VDARLKSESSAEMEAAAREKLADASPWLPLRVPIFRAFWIASIVSNIGTWVHDVGAGWLMTGLDGSPAMVAAVRVAITLPTILLAIPAGVLADRVDRRLLLIATQLMLFMTTATLASLTWAGWITAWTLLGLTLVVGLGKVLHALSWQATVPVLVPQPQLSRAVALNSLSFNLARSLGPALGGLLIAAAGVWITFAVNACSFAGVLIVLVTWRRERVEHSGGETFRSSLTSGIRFVWEERRMRNVLFSVVLFMLPATSLWALMPLVAKEHLQWDAIGFGTLVTTIGIGAVLAARFLHHIHQAWTADRTVSIAMLLYAASLTFLAATDITAVALLATLVLGMAWMMTLTTLNTIAQLTLPDAMRARGMGCYMTTIAASMSAGSLLWGQVATVIGVANALLVAAAVLLSTAWVRTRLKAV